MDHSCFSCSESTTLCGKRSVDIYSSEYWIAAEQMMVVTILFIPQVPELFGPIRTIAEGKGEAVLIGTTKNFVLKGNLDGEFMPITQVRCMHIFIYTTTIDFSLI